MERWGCVRRREHSVPSPPSPILESSHDETKRKVNEEVGEKPEAEVIIAACQSASLPLRHGTRVRLHQQGELY